MVNRAILALLLGLCCSIANALPMLTPSMKCSACEVTAREIFNQYNKYSKNDKFAGTEVEMATVLDDACKGIARKYAVAQEQFGAHLKVFADVNSNYDMQNVEAPDFYSKKDEAQYVGATVKLEETCEELVGQFEDHIVDLVKDRADENNLRKFMCLEQTDVCTADALKKYKKKEGKRRRKWRAKQQGTKTKEKLAEELQKDLEEELGKKPPEPEKRDDPLLELPNADEM